MTPARKVGERRRPRDAEAERLVDAMGLLFMHVREHFEQGVQRFDLPVPCAKALRVIDGPISMKELGARIFCDASFITAIADTLEERGLVRREVDPADRRIKRLVLTDKGVATRERIVDELFSDLPCVRTLDTAERTSLLQLLECMLQREQAARIAAGEDGSAA